MIIFENDLYVVGGCISAWVHKQYIKKLNLDIKLIVMVDEKIYKYKDELKKYFDEIVLINLIEMKLNPEYKVIYKYSKWMHYSINKWQILNLDYYDKILFIDTDILPICDKFYDIFLIDTPGITIKDNKSKFNDIANPQDFSDKKTFENNEYFNASLKLKKSLDAGLILFKPDKKLYAEYINFIKICENKSGYISMYHSSVDETTILLFLMFYKKKDLHLIPYDFATIPWENVPYDKNKVKGINFLSMIKPWVKLPIIQFAEENIWHKIVKKAFDKKSILTTLYLKYLINELYDFYFSYKKNLTKHNSPYNMECLKNKKLASHTYNLFSFLKNNKKENLNIENIEQIINMTVLIHKNMDKKLLIDIDELENII